MRRPAGFTALEAAAGFPWGGRRATPVPGRGEGGPLAALFEATADALLQPPCVVSFSGGRDSSLLLAVAASVAAARGLEPPLPVTLRYPQAPEADETRWQERVIAHLGLSDWIRIELSDQLDCVGPIAAEQMLREHAPLFPANAHSVVPPSEHARGGTVVMGIGGDELLASQRFTPLTDMLAGRRRPAVRDLPDLGMALLPQRWRGLVTALRDDLPGGVSWLRPATRRRMRAALAAVPGDSVRFDQAVLEMAGLRYLELGNATIRRIAQSRGAEVSMPLLDPRFVSALARAGGRWGWGSRTPTMRALFASLLPDDVLSRTDKATFTGAFFTQRTREFAARWSGQGLDEELVDPEALRSMWLGQSPDFRSAVLLQTAWLHDELDRGTDSGQDRLHEAAALQGDQPSS